MMKRPSRAYWEVWFTPNDNIWMWPDCQIFYSYQDALEFAVLKRIEGCTDIRIENKVQYVKGVSGPGIRSVRQARREGRFK